MEATRWVFDVCILSWVDEMGRVHVEEVSCSRGQMRLVYGACRYHMWNLEARGGSGA